MILGRGDYSGPQPLDLEFYANPKLRTQNTSTCPVEAEAVVESDKDLEASGLGFLTDFKLTVKLYHHSTQINNNNNKVQREKAKPNKPDKLVAGHHSVHLCSQKGVITEISHT